MHAGVAAKADERQKPGRFRRYISRSAVSEKRLSLTSNGNLRYPLRAPYRDGTPHVIFEPPDCMAQLAAFGCSRIGQLREALSFLGEIMENRVLMLPVLAGKPKLNEDAYNSAFRAGVGDRTEVRHTCRHPSGSSYVKVDCEMDDTVYEGGMDKCSSLDSVQQALFFAHLTGKPRSDN